MKIVKVLLIAIAIIIGLPLIIAAIAPKDMHYEKSIKINASQDVVWSNVNSLAALDLWSPWNDYDPDMKKTISGTDGTIGATRSWESDVENVGVGSQTISGIEPKSKLTTDIKFIVPFESDAKSYITLQSAGEQTVVTWGFDSKMPYPANLMLLFKSMEDMMGKDWENGLNKLKNLCE